MSEFLSDYLKAQSEAAQGHAHSSSTAPGYVQAQLDNKQPKSS
jgi:hypothetical protein